MGRLEDGGQRVTLVPWPHRRVHPVRLQRAAAAALSYDDYLASLEGEDAEEGGLFGFVLHRESLLHSSLPCPSIPGSGRSRLQVRILLYEQESTCSALPGQALPATLDAIEMQDVDLCPGFTLCHT